MPATRDLADCPKALSTVHRWRAEVLAATSQVDAARAALDRANAEVDARATKLRVPELRRLFRASHGLPRP